MPVALSARDVKDLLSFDDGIEVTERTYREAKLEDLRVHSPVRMKIPHGSLRIVAGALLHENVMGARLGSASGLAGNMSPMVLFDPRSGDLLAIMAYPFSVMRTGVTVAVATKWIAPKEARTAALLGTGRNALSALRGMAAVRPIDDARIFSRTRERREALAREASDVLGIRVTAAASSEEAVDGADLIACVTNAPDHVFDADRVGPEVHINSVGSVNEVPDEIFRDATGIFLGSKSQELQYAHYHSYSNDVPRNALLEVVDEGLVAWDQVHDLGVAVTGWDRPKGVTVFKETRGGVGDVALAYAAYRRAQEEGRGTELDL